MDFKDRRPAIVRERIAPDPDFDPFAYYAYVARLVPRLGRGDRTPLPLPRRWDGTDQARPA